MTHLRQIMLELERRNYALGTITSYIRTVEHFAQHFHRAPDQLGPSTFASIRQPSSASGTCTARRLSVFSWNCARGRY